MNEPLVSVIFAVYNGSRYLRESIRSILMQSGVALEVIAIDDGSTDDTAPILDEFAANDSRVHVLHQSNAGLTVSLIRGVELARGKYVARHDADDLSLPGRLAAQVRILDSEPRVAFVSCWARVVGPKGELLHEITRPNSRTEQLREEKGPCGHGSVMMRREAYLRAGGYRPEFWFAQDWDLWWRLSEQGALMVIPEFLYAYRFDDAGTSAAHRDLQQRYGAIAADCAAARAKGLSEEALLTMARGLTKNGLKTRVSPAAADYFIGRSLMQRRDPAARGYLWKCVRRQPWRVRAWMSLAQIGLKRGVRG